MVRSHGTARRDGSPRQSKAGSTTTHLGTKGALSRSSKVGVVAGFHRVAEDRGVPVEVAEMAAGIGIEQQLVRIEAVAGIGLVRPMHAVAIDRAGMNVGQIAMPDLVGVFRQAGCARARARPSRRRGRFPPWWRWRRRARNSCPCRPSLPPGDGASLPSTAASRRPRSFPPRLPPAPRAEIAPRRRSAPRRPLLGFFGYPGRILNRFSQTETLRGRNWLPREAVSASVSRPAERPGCGVAPASRPAARPPCSAGGKNHLFAMI